jgi:hypothetical protein
MLGAGAGGALMTGGGLATGGTATGTAISSLPAYTPYTSTAAEKIGNVVVPIGLSMIAGKGFNDLTKATSGKTLAQEIGSYFPKSARSYAEFAGEFLNPGYLFGGVAVKPLTKGINYLSNGVNKLKGVYEYYKFMKNPVQYAQKNNILNSVIFDKNGVPKMIYTNGQVYSYNDVVNMAKAKNSTNIVSTPKALTGEIMGQRRSLPEPISFDRFREGLYFNQPDIWRIYDSLDEGIRRGLSDNNSLIAVVQHEFENPNSILYRRSINDLIPNELQLTNGNIKDAFNLYKINNMLDPEFGGLFPINDASIQLLGKTSEGTLNVNNPLFKLIKPEIRKKLTLSPE